LSPFSTGQASLKTGNGRRQGSDRLIKQAVLAVFTIVVVSLLFFLPSEYKGPETIRSEVPDRSVPVSPVSAVPSPPTAAVPEPVTTPPYRQTRWKKRRFASSRTGTASVIICRGGKYYDHLQAYHRVHLSFRSRGDRRSATGKRRAERSFVNVPGTPRRLPGGTAVSPYPCISEKNGRGSSV
jgi:hypothetical protein